MSTILFLCSMQKQGYFDIPPLFTNMTIRGGRNNILPIFVAIMAIMIYLYT